MNRKTKIIVSVVGITIVLLALLGITYAYYLTRIEGNTNTNSISVTTADLKLSYGDGNGLITKTDIMPGTTITKTFTVTNDGNSKVNGYVVVLEDIDNDLERTSDLVYTLTCKLNDATSCGFTEEVIYPSGRELAVIFTNDIAIGTTHNYTLVVTYKNHTDIDQSVDMGSTINGKINIYDGNQINPYSLADATQNATSLTYNIINNARTNANGTTFSAVPLTTPAKEISGENERTLSIIQDNLGASYYYRGSVQDNYVLFNNMCFRIVRIEGDGSVKLIYAGDVTEGATNCNEVGTNTGLLKDSDDNTISPIYGYAEDYHADYENNAAGKAEGTTGLKEELETWYTSKFNTDTLKEKLKIDKWCLGGNEEYKYDSNGNLFTEITLEEFYDENGQYEWYYAAGSRVWNTKTTSLMCENEDYVSSKYGTITSDEVMIAGGTTDSNTIYYLYENAQGEYYWTLSLDYFDGYDDYAFCVYSSGDLDFRDDVNVHSNGGVRPSVTLVNGTTITGGVGTKTNPYVIN